VLYVVLIAWLAGSIPVSNIAARWLRGTDLRTVDSGTVSGTNLYRIAGFVPLAVFGVLDVAKGALGPALAGSDHHLLQAVSGGAAVAGHNWSPWLRWSGGRGISPAMGALLVTAPVGAAVLLGGMAIGKIGGETAIGALAADAVLVPVTAAVHGPAAAWCAVAVLVPMLVKRVAGNSRAPRDSRWRVYGNRLLLDRDHRVKQPQA
jgi:glycerol-3-phosphate acyltransferase PlsY